MESNATATVHPPLVERVRLAVRERPASEEELPLTQVRLRTDKDKLIAFAPDADDGFGYDFDYLYPQNSQQQDLFHTIGLEMVDLVVGGISANCVTVGYAETGKTHSLFGSAHEEGLVQETVRQLFRRLEAAASSHEYSVSMAYWEMDCDAVRDNLTDAPPTRADGKPASHSVYRDGFGRLYLSNVSDVPVATFAEFETLLQAGNERRIERGRSRRFRWHGFVQLGVTTVDRRSGEQCVLRRMTFVHSKGPERVGANGARGTVLAEGSRINVSTLLLHAAVIHSLEYRAKRERRCRTQEELHRLILQSESFFMECKYTQMMSQLLCGHEASFALGCVDPLSYKETIETLESLQLFRRLRSACLPVVASSEKGRLMRRLRAMEASFGSPEMVASVYVRSADRPLTEEEEKMVELRGRIEGWSTAQPQREEEMPGNGTVTSSSAGERRSRAASSSSGQLNASTNGARKKIYLNPAKTATYEGQWADGTFGGFGEHIQANFIYRGEFRAGLREGEGTLLLREGKAGPGASYRRVYEGEWLAGQRDGRGTQWCKDGEVYEGDFVADKRCGSGRLYLPSGDVIDGHFAENLCNGWAVLRQVNGDWFEGYWCNGVREGPGVWHYPARQRLLRGEWHNNVAVMGTMEDDAEKVDDSCSGFIPRLGLADSDGVLAKELERLQERRRLAGIVEAVSEPAAVGQYHAADATTNGAAAVVYGMEIE